jgi:ElaB/YqjD/DUF883 family membrane-anchored ribosome-binding protein
MKKELIAKLDGGLEVSGEKMLEELRVVVNNAEDLLHTTANQAGEGVAAARARIQENLKNVKHRLHEAEALVLDQSRHAVKTTDKYVHANPWQSIGVAVCAGVIFGLLIKRE